MKLTNVPCPGHFQILISQVFVDTTHRFYSIVTIRAQSNYVFFFSPMSVAVRLATNYYERISRRGTATILLSKHISCIAIEKL